MTSDERVFSAMGALFTAVAVGSALGAVSFVWLVAQAVF
jgi:hypothetical protein